MNGRGGSCVVFLAWISAVLGCSGVTVERAKSKSIERRVLLMGTWFDAEISSESEADLDSLFSRMVETVRKTERQFSTWLEGSDLSSINKNPSVFKTSGIRRDLQRILFRSQKLNGAFHAGIGKWILASGARSGHWRPHALLQLSQKERIPQSPDDPQWLWEEGGFAKGLALDRIQEQLQRELSDPLQAGLKVSLNFGGQILHCGSGRKQVILGRPQFRNERTLEFWVQNESVSTSGQIEKPGHIIDPKTGLSAPDLGTATALHSSSELADMVSTALLVMGPAQAKKWWDKVSGDGELASLEWIWIERSGVITATCGLKTRHLISYADSSKIHWLGNCLTKSQ